MQKKERKRRRLTDYESCMFVVFKQNCYHIFIKMKKMREYTESRTITIMDEYYSIGDFFINIQYDNPCPVSEV